MKSTSVLSPILLAATNINLANAWLGRSLTEIPKARLHKSKYYDHRGLDAKKGSPLGNIAGKKSMRPMEVRGGSSLGMSTITSLIPVVGIVTSTLLYFSPMAVVRAATRDNSLGDLNPIPLAIMAVGTLCWLVYGLSIQDPYIIVSNVPGCIASIWYVTAVLPLLKGSQLQTTQNIIVAMSAVVINLWTYLSLTNKPVVKVRSALGLFASAVSVVLSGSPLSTIKTVISTRDSGSILAPMTFAQVTNAALWGAYGLAIKDKFVIGPNLLGLGFGLIQLLLKIVFPSK